MNTPGRFDGGITVAIDGTTRISYDRVLYRKGSDARLEVDGVMFATWFGGSDESWAPAKDQVSYWRNFRLYKL